MSVCDRGHFRNLSIKFRFTPNFGAFVDVVYIGTVNSTHYDVCKLMLAQNKHVLCEKSLTLLQRHTQELIKIAEEKKVFFQEVREMS